MMIVNEKKEAKYFFISLIIDFLLIGSFYNLFFHFRYRFHHYLNLVVWYLKFTTFLKKENVLLEISLRLELME
jgi:hypothetical protein